MIKTLMPHQKEALNYAKNHANPAFFMEMRLGKTLTALRWAQGLRNNGKLKVLILAPKSVLPAWKAELECEGLGKFTVMPKGSTKKKFQSMLERVTLNTTYVLTNYETVTHCPEVLTDLPWNVLICDESTRLRNPQAQITKKLINFGNHIPHKAILSGLPAPESQLDYVTQFIFLNGQFMGYDNYWHFRNRFFQSFNGYNWVARSGMSEKIKKVVNQLGFIRTRKQVGLGSKKIYECRYVDMTPEQRRLYSQAEKDFEMTVGEDTIDTKWVPVKFGWMAQICGGIANMSERQEIDGKRKVVKVKWVQVSRAKLDELLELLEGELKGEKVIVWFKHNVELEMVASELARKGYNVGRYNSSCRSGINGDGTLAEKTDVMCAQSKCGLFGLDWSKASTAIYYSNWYDSEIRHQTEDRIAHPKKSEPLLYIDLLVKESVDEDIRNLLVEKKLTCRYTMVDLIQQFKERKSR